MKTIVLFIAAASLLCGQSIQIPLPTSYPPNGAAGGALTGTYPSPTLAYTATNPQTGTTYAILTGDRGKLITFTNANPIAVSIAACGSTGFPDGWDTTLLNAPGAGTLTLTPATSTVEGAATLVLPTTQAVHLWCNGTNYRATWNISDAVIGASALTTAGAIPYVTSAGVLGQDQTAGGQLFWDAANHRLGVGTMGPTQKLDVSGGIRATGASTASSGVGMEMSYESTFGVLVAYDRTSPAYKQIRINDLLNVGLGSTGNVGIGTTSPGGLFSAVNRTATTGATLINLCTDGTNVSAVDCRVVTRAGTTQGTTNLHEWQNAAGAVISSIGPTGVFKPFTLALQSLATPGTVTSTPTCASACSTTWTYKIVALAGDGTVTLPGAANANATDQNATLSASNKNVLTWSAVTGATSYQVWMTATGGTPATLGKIATVTALTYSHEGANGDGGSIPTVNTTGVVTGKHNSGDGSVGFTGTACTAFKDGLCVSGT